ncbi:MAG: Ig-like domain repeat protein [Planctomycetes bacterium]|nr:Ig-like domain repeat protein [Planctomycetota bacterium]
MRYRPEMILLEDRITPTLGFTIAPGATLDIFPISSIIPTTPAGMDRMEVLLTTVPGVSHGTISRVSGLTVIPWGSGPPNTFMPGAGNDRIFGGEGFRYENDGTGAGTSESIPIKFRDSTGFNFVNDTIVISINANLTPPTITTQPAPFIQISPGQTATMSVVATGDPPLTYQWYEGFVPDTSNPVAGATSSTFTTPVLIPIQQFHYWVQVTSSGGVANSNGVTVQVATPTSVSTSDASATFSTSAQTITLSATVSPAVSVGNVRFTVLGVGTATSGTVTNGASGATTFSIPANTPAGTYNLEAHYQAPAGTAESFDNKTLTINRADTTTTGNNATATASGSDQTISLSATVTSGAGPVNEGVVTFTVFDGAVQIGSAVTSATVSNGSAGASFTLPANSHAGAYAIRAVYKPGPDYNGSSDLTRTLTVSPVVTPNSNTILGNAGTLLITGLGFDSATPGNNIVTFNNGATGTVTAATATQLTVTSLTGLAAGPLTASVSVDGVSSGAPVQVATVTPVVTSTTASLAINATTMTIDGFGFSTTPGNNIVTFSGGATGTVTAASANQLTVSNLTGLTLGELDASVTAEGISSGAPVQVATVVPVITPSNANLPVIATTLIINGFGFDPTAANDVVSFSGGVTGTVTAATSNSITISNLTGLAAGALSASVTVDGVSSGAPVQVATVIPLADLAVSIVPLDPGLIVGDIVTLTITVTNTGPGTAQTVSLSDLLPAELTFISQTQTSGPAFTLSNNGNQISDTIPSLASGASAAIVVRAQVNANVANNTPVSDSASIAATNSVDNNGANDIATVQTTIYTAPLFTLNPANGALAGEAGTTQGWGFSIDNTTPFWLIINGSAFLLPTFQGLLGHGFGIVPSTDFGTYTDFSQFNFIVIAPASTFTASFTNNPASGVGSFTINPNATPSTLPADPALQVPNQQPGMANGAIDLIYSLYSRDPNDPLFDPTTDTLGNPFEKDLLAPASVTIVVPVVTPNTANLPANATTLIIQGTGFDAATPGNNVVTFSGGVAGTVTASSFTSLTVTGLSGLIAGPLSATVTTDGVSSGAPVQVATVTPVVTASTAQLLNTLPTVTINGFGFDSTPANNTVVFNLGAVGTVTAATANQVTVTFSSQPSPGALTAIVTSNGVSSGPAVQVATVITLTITPNAADLAQNAPTIIISGAGFSTTLADDSVVFDNGAAGTVTAATPTQLTVTFTTNPTGLGALNATVAVVGTGTAGPTQVATIVAKPTVSLSAADLQITATTITINGTGFSTTPTNNSVVFNLGATGIVIGSTPTSLSILFTTSPTSVGGLTAIVTSNGGSSGAPVQVASVIPVVNPNASLLPADSTTLIISGFGFSSNPSDNVVTLSGGATGTVIASTFNQLTVANLSGLVSGALNASVSVLGFSSGAPVQVATVFPILTASTADLPANSNSMIINGFGFSSNPGDNIVSFSGGATGAVTAATNTQLTVSGLSGLVAGPLSATVTTNGVTKGGFVQVATVSPVVTPSTDQIANSNTLIINGFGFDGTPANNTVLFNLGAVGAVTAASPNQLTVTFSAQPSVGSLTAIVTSNGVSSGAAVQVASVVTIDLSALPNWTINQTYTPSVTATGGTGPFTFTVTGGGLPNGLMLNTDGTFAGAPTALGTFNFTITATQSAFASGSRVYSVTINDVPTVSNLTVTAWTRGKSGFTGTMTISGGTPPHVITASSNIPTGLTPVLAGNTISFTGTPTVAGTFNGSITIKDSAGATFTKTFTIKINPPIVFNLPALPAYVVGFAYNQSLKSVSGGTGAITFTFAFSRALPAGLTFNAATGIISGTPTAAVAPITITVTATDSVGAVTVKVFTLTSALGPKRRGL